MKQRIMQRALDIAEEQGMLANSPAEIGGNGKINLCAASCIAKAALEIMQGEDDANKFEDLLLRKNKKEYVPSQFENLGLSNLVAKAVMLENDQMNSSKRMSWFRNLELA